MLLVDAGFAAILTASFARGGGAGADDRNLVLWRWGETGTARLTVEDDDRLRLAATDQRVTR